jgi:hypothetical protein
VFDEPGSVRVGGGIIAETLSMASLTDASGLLPPDIPYKYHKCTCIAEQHRV